MKDIFISFHKVYEVKSLFLYVSKAFDKVWHKGLLFQLSQSDISGNLLNIFESNELLSMLNSGTMVISYIHKRFI